MLLESIQALCREEHLADVGAFCCLPGEEMSGLGWGVSVVARLSDAVLDELDGAPTHTYFHHYRTVNAYLDRVTLKISFLLAEEGYRFLPIGASQSVPTPEDPHGYHGRFSHKKAACLAGLGAMGKSGLFLHRAFGPRVRLGTLFTDCPLVERNPEPLPSPCGGCELCRRVCPAQAISGIPYEPGMPEHRLVDPALCSRYMKAHFQQIGRGAVCGLCIQICPQGKAHRP